MKEITEEKIALPQFNLMYKKWLQKIKKINK